MPVGEQVAILYCGVHGLMREIAVDRIAAFQDTFLQRLRAEHQEDVLDVLASGKMTDEVIAVIQRIAADTVSTYKA